MFETPLAVGLGVVVTLVVIVDVAGRHFFWEPLYSVGLPVLTSNETDLARPVIAVGTVAETEHGKYKFITSNRLLVREKYPLFGQNQSGVLGTIDWSSGVATVTGRVAPVYLVSAVAFVALAPSVDPDSGSIVIGLLMALVFIAIVTGMSRYRMKRLLLEYREAQVGMVGHA